MNIKKLCLLTLIPALGIGSAAAQTLDFFKNYGHGLPATSAHGVANTRDGNFVFAGTMIHPGAAEEIDMYVVKTKPNGDTLWTRTIGTPGYVDIAYHVSQESNDPGLFVAGLSISEVPGSNAEAVLIKLNVLGDIIWKKNFPVANANTFFTDLKQLNDGLVLSGVKGTAANGDGDGWLVKTDFMGNMTWDRTFGGTGYDDFWQIEKTPEGGFVLGGSSDTYRSGTTGADAWLVKTDRLGSQIWSKHYGTADSKNNINSLCVANRAGAVPGYVFTGAKNVDHATLNTGLFFAKVDSAGNLLWDKSITSTTVDYVEGFAVEQTYDGGLYLAAGESHPVNGAQLLTMKTDQAGNVINRFRYGTFNKIAPHSIFINTLGDAYIAGGHNNAQDESTAFLTHIQRIDAVPNSVNGVTALDNAGFTVFPNPATDNGCTVSSDVQPIYHIQIKDITGRILRDIPCSGNLSERISLDGIPKGNVLIHVFTGRPGETTSIAPVILRLTIL
jgi:hypothetical protein